MRLHREPVSRVCVVVPARNEEATLGRALDSIARAAARVPDVRVEVVVVANGCEDATEAVARDHGVHVLVERAPNVGAARAAGAAFALRDGSAGLWIASTDADSIVPPDWLVEHVRTADEGADVVLGTVVLAPDDALRHGAWVARYAEGVTAGRHVHVHGANLGVRASEYVRAGGFQALALHEDADLVARLVAIDAAVAWVTDVPVVTSARHDARAVGGVGADLAASG